MDKKELMKLAYSFQKKSDAAYESYQETCMSRYGSAYRRNEDIAEAIRIAAEAEEEHLIYRQEDGSVIICADDMFIRARDIVAEDGSLILHPIAGCQKVGRWMQILDYEKVSFFCHLIEAAVNDSLHASRNAL